MKPWTELPSGLLGDMVVQYGLITGEFSDRVKTHNIAGKHLVKSIYFRLTLEMTSSMVNLPL